MNGASNLSVLLFQCIPFLILFHRTAYQMLQVACILQSPVSPGPPTPGHVTVVATVCCLQLQQECGSAAAVEILQFSGCWCWYSAQVSRLCQLANPVSSSFVTSHQEASGR